MSGPLPGLGAAMRVRLGTGRATRGWQDRRVVGRARLLAILENMAAGFGGVVTVEDAVRTSDGMSCRPRSSHMNSTARDWRTGCSRSVGVTDLPSAGVLFWVSQLM